MKLKTYTKLSQLLELLEEIYPKDKNMKLEKYEDLVHGMYVTCEIDGKKIEDARLSIDEDGDVHICQNEKNGSKADELFGYTYSWLMVGKNKDIENWEGDVTNLNSVEEKTLDNLKLGDVLMNDDGDSVTIEGESCYKTNIGYCSAKELKKGGFKIVNTFTKEEAEKKLGVKIID